MRFSHSLASSDLPVQIGNTGIDSLVGQFGFDKMEVGEISALVTHGFAHYLHRKYFDVNHAGGVMGINKLLTLGMTAARKSKPQWWCAMLRMCLN